MQENSTEAQEIKNRELLSRRVAYNKSRLFGPRFIRATLSGILLNQSDTGKIMDWLKAPKNMLVMLGNPGIGKTEICAAIYDWIAHKSNESVRYWSERKLFESLRTDIADGRGEHIQNLRSKTDDVLVFLDDLGSDHPNEWRIDVLFNFLDYRYETMLPTVITSNLNRKQIAENYGERFASRLCASENTILDLFNYPDLRQQGY